MLWIYNLIHNLLYAHMRVAGDAAAFKNTQHNDFLVVNCYYRYKTNAKRRVFGIQIKWFWLYIMLNVHTYSLKSKPPKGDCYLKNKYHEAINKLNA